MFRDWVWANDYLSRGRKKYERPAYDRGLRLWKENRWDPDSSINLGWKWGGINHNYVTYHKDGSTTISGCIGTGIARYMSLYSQSVRLTISRYAGIKVFQRNFKFYLQEHDAQISPVKIQGCRNCAQTGLVEMLCSSSNCYAGELLSNGEYKCSIHPSVVIKTSTYGSHPIACEHGRIGWHKVPRAQKCYSCNGNKKRDYGSKPERTQWDGTPLRLRDGKIIKTAATLLERMVADYVEPIG